jgi:hypothetical protein
MQVIFLSEVVFVMIVFIGLSLNIDVLRKIATLFYYIKYPYVVKLSGSSTVYVNDLEKWRERYLPNSDIFLPQWMITVTKLIVMYNNVSLMSEQPKIRFRTKSDSILFNLTFER